MFGLLKPNLGSSAEQIDIVDIQDGVLRLSGNRYRLVLQTSSINFELKSEEEQDAIVDIYEGFLNSIGFPIQLLIRTREIDMDDYLEQLSMRLEKENQPIYKEQLKNYRSFIKSLISDNKILSRQFYLIVPFKTEKSSDSKLASEQLVLRSDIVIKNLSRLGIVCHQLSSIEVIDLFYSFYSPTMAKLQPITGQILEIINANFIVRRQDEIKSS